MVQLSLIAPTGIGLDEQLERAARQWPEGGSVAAQARAATATRFRAWAGRSLDEAEQRRVAAYFNAIMRRRVMRSPDAQCARARQLLIAASIEADLREAGWRPEAARREARRAAGLGEMLGGAA